MYRNKRSGVYKIRPLKNQSIFDVYCDHETGTGGWINIGERAGGDLSFYDKTFEVSIQLLFVFRPEIHSQKSAKLSFLTVCCNLSTTCQQSGFLPVVVCRLVTNCWNNLHATSLWIWVLTMSKLSQACMRTHPGSKMSTDLLPGATTKGE